MIPSPMRRLIANVILLGLLLPAAALRAGDGKVIKVLPQLLDQQGHHALAPSLYERDAYQSYLRKHPESVSGVRLAVQWKASGVDWSRVKIRAEMRGLVTNHLQNVVIEEPVKKHGFPFHNWIEFDLTGDKYKNFGDLVAWQVSLWEGDKELSSRKSFLWSDLPARIP